MWHAASTVAAILLLSIHASAEVEDATQLGDLEQQLDAELLREMSHHRRHHRHSRHFLHRRPTSLLMDPSPEEEEMPKSRFPVVAKHLKGMTAEMHGLKIHHHAAKQARRTYEDDVKAAIMHINKVVAIKSQLAHTEVQIQAEEKKIRQLEEDHLRMDRTHHRLVASLHHVMDPKISFAKARLAQWKERLQRAKAKVAGWSLKESTFHAASLSALQQRDMSKEHLEAAEEAEEKAHKERILAGKELREAKKNANLNIARYRYSKTKATAATSQEKQEEQEMQDSQTSVNRLQHILELQEHRVDESMALGKDKVRGKVDEVQKKEQKSEERLARLKQEYSQWQYRNSDWSNRLLTKAFNAEAADRIYADGRKAVLDAADNQLVAESQGDSDSGDSSDWAWNQWAKDQR